MAYRFYYMALYYFQTQRHMIKIHILGIPMGTRCALLVADLFYHERDFMLSLSDNNQSDVIEALNPTSKYVDDLPNINNPYFEQMIGQINIYPTKLSLDKAYSPDTEPSFLDLYL